MRVAAIDCGTNTIRLLIADLFYNGATWDLKPVYVGSEIVRLGQGVDASGYLSETALKRTLAVVDAYAQRCRTAGVEQTRFIATSATRDAANRLIFVEGVRKRLGVDPEVISGKEEAYLSFLGTSLTVNALVGTTSPYLVVDLGGGSTELVLGTTCPQCAFSMDTGSVRVTERYLASGVSVSAETRARSHVRQLLDRAQAVVDLSAAAHLVGVAGTITTITAQALGLNEFDPQQLDGACVSVEKTLTACERIVHSTPSERQSWAYLQAGRRDVIAAGALIWSEIIKRVATATSANPAPVQTTITSMHDILHGIALSMAPEIATR